MHPPLDHDAFPPCFRFPPISDKFSDFLKNFDNFTFSRKISWLSSATNFPPCFRQIHLLFTYFTCIFPPLLWPWCIYASPNTRTGRPCPFPQNYFNFPDVSWVKILVYYIPQVLYRIPWGIVKNFFIILDLPLKLMTVFKCVPFYNPYCRLLKASVYHSFTSYDYRSKEHQIKLFRGWKWRESYSGGHGSSLQYFILLWNLARDWQFFSETATVG